MIVCGIDIKGKEAILALVRNAPEETVHVACATKKLILLNDRDKKSLVSLKSAIEAFAHQNKVDAFVIKSRLATGPRAGGGVTFKIEALFQLSETRVLFISPQELAKFAKSNLGGLPTTVTGYQKDAYRAAALYLSKE